jgi:hypothetical protein
VLATTDGIVGRVTRSIERSREALHRYQVLGDRLAAPMRRTSASGSAGSASARRRSR